MASTKFITTCLWFDTQAEQAAQFYISLFPRSKITDISRYTEAGQEVHGKPPGSVMVVAFELDGKPFIGLNGGPQFKFSEAVSFQISCDTQDEIDRYWDALCDGGEPGQCGWLKDRFGLSWQVTPSCMAELMSGPGANRAMTTMMGMQKMDIAALQRAASNP